MKRKFAVGDVVIVHMSVLNGPYWEQFVGRAGRVCRVDNEELLVVRFVPVNLPPEYDSGVGEWFYPSELEYATDVQILAYKLGGVI